jgi:uncharacterized protein (TIGR00661 family)
MQVDQIFNKTVLISPLDWGFGHTTRCFTIIERLIKQNNNIIFAGNNNQTDFIKKEYPNINIAYIEGYNIQLSSKKSTYWQIAKQLTSIFKSIKNENKWVENYVNQYKIDLIISDNRYGFRSDKVQSIFMGHQLNVFLPRYRRIINNKLSQYINSFNECWIVDDSSINLAGELSQPKYITIPFIYIGLLNRFKNQDLEIKYDHLIIVSGAYPENEIFLKQIEFIFSQRLENIAIVSTIKSIQPINNASYYYNPDTITLNRIINQSKEVVSKLGYTTLMEMVCLKKKSTLIPTKGQYEQEYLSRHVKTKSIRIIENINAL